MYMSRKAVRMVVVDKINDAMSWDCKSIEDVKFQVRSMEIAKKVSDIIDQIKICDPAVGDYVIIVSWANSFSIKEYPIYQNKVDVLYRVTNEISSCVQYISL